MFILLQTPPPSEITPANLQAWLLYGLLAVGGGALAFLVQSVRDREKGRDAAVDKMVQIMEKVIEKSDLRHEHAEQQHEKDREAFLQSTGGIQRALSEVATLQREHTGHLVEIKQMMGKPPGH